MIEFLMGVAAGGAGTVWVINVARIVADVLARSKRTDQ